MKVIPKIVTEVQDTKEEVQELPVRIGVDDYGGSGMKFETLTKQEWIDLHNKPDMVSASQIYSIIGESEYQSAYTLWAIKTGRVEPEPENRSMRIGHGMEPIITKEYEIETGTKLTDPGDYAILRHPDYPWLFATLDRYRCCDGHNMPVELKHTHYKMRDWVDEAPLFAQAQVQIQMACCGAKSGEIIGLSGTNLFIYQIQRHDELIHELIQSAKNFRELCLSDTPPGVDGSVSTSSTLDKLYPDNDPDKCVTLDDSFDGIAEALKDVKEEIKTLDKGKRYYENLIKEKIGDAEFGVTEAGTKFSYKTITRKGYTTKDTSFRQLRQIGG